MNDWMNGLTLPPLLSGAHDSPDKGVCAMELVAFIERLPHSDSPECTCPVIAAFVRGFNDMMNDHERQQLLPYLPRLVGTVSPEHEGKRAEMAAWKAIKVFAPLALQRRFPEHAKTLAQFDERKGLKAAAAYAAKAYAAKAYAAAHAAADAAKAYAAAYDAAKAYAAKAAAYAADAAAAAAYAAHAAHAAIRKQIIAACFELLEQMLSIGPQGRFRTNPEEVLKEFSYVS
jgi:hypothetical protein